MSNIFSYQVIFFGFCSIVSIFHLVEVLQDPCDSEYEKQVQDKRKIARESWEIGEKCNSENESCNLWKIFLNFQALVNLSFAKRYFGNIVKQLFLDYTRECVARKNDPAFTFETSDPRDFLAIITLLCFNVSPQFNLYWSTCLSSLFVSFCLVIIFEKYKLISTFVITIILVLVINELRCDLCFVFVIKN